MAKKYFFFVLGPVGAQKKLKRMDGLMDVQIKNGLA